MAALKDRYTFEGACEGDTAFCLKASLMACSRASIMANGRITVLVSGRFAMIQGFCYKKVFVSQPSLATPPCSE